jgi:hypothetical protein
MPRWLMLVAAVLIIAPVGSPALARGGHPAAQCHGLHRLGCGLHRLGNGLHNLGNRMSHARHHRHRR